MSESRMHDSRGRSITRVPARDVPIPASISDAAQAQMALEIPLIAPLPAADDLDAWREFVVEIEQRFIPATRELSKLPVDMEDLDVEGTRVYVGTPQALATDDRHVVLDFHGGGLFMGGGELARATTFDVANRLAARVWSVDYGLPPDRPFPAGLNNCVTVYRKLLEDHSPDEIIVTGISAGSNLAAAMILKARDEGLPLPAAAVLLTPELDLTESGDTFLANKGVDLALTGDLMPANLLYAAGHDLTDPYISPLFGDFTKGFPPTLLNAGTRDLFLSNAVRMHRALRAADVAAELHITEAASHGGFPGTPEDEDLYREVRLFMDQYWRRNKS